MLWVEQQRVDDDFEEAFHVQEQLLVDAIQHTPRGLSKWRRDKANGGMTVYSL